MSEASPRVSVIMPVYNRTHLLRRSVTSVLRQSITDLELIVVDDASEEDVQATLNLFDDSRIRYVRRQSRGGPAAARNTGIDHARADYLAFQDSDDEWLLDKLKCQFAAMDSERNDIEVVCCAMLRPHPTHVSCYSAPVEARQTSLAARRWIESECKAFTQTWLVRRDVLDAVGPFDERLTVWEDWELLLRIAQSYPVRFIQDALVISYASSDSISSRVSLRIQSLEHLLAKTRAQQHPRVVARLAYMLGWFRIHAGDMSEARRALRYSLVSSPRSIRAWVLLFASFLGQQFASRLLSDHHLVAD